MESCFRLSAEKCSRGNICSCPPCPADELPDLVHMQADIDTTTSEELEGFDFLPLSGDEIKPNHVLGISMEDESLEKLKTIWEKAEIVPNRLVPLALGWPRRCQEERSMPTTIRSASLSRRLHRRPLFWATINSRIILFRRIQLPSADNFSSLENTVTAELRRYHARHRPVAARGRRHLYLDCRQTTRQNLPSWVDILDRKFEAEIYPMGFLFRSGNSHRQTFRKSLRRRYHAPW